MEHSSEIRILIVDDLESIHTDFRKILISNDQGSLEEESLYLDERKSRSEDKTISDTFVLDSAFQGQQGIDLVQQALKEEKPYALAFVDIRMPPGIDGVQTIKKMWEADPNLQAVICTAYSDASWEDINEELNASENFLILKKPFEVIEIRQLATALTKKWKLKKQLDFQIDHLQELVAEQTAEIEKSFSRTRAILEATQEGILEVALDQKLPICNKIFFDIWELPESILASGAESIFKAMAEKAEEPKLLLTVLNDLLEIKKVGNIKEWKTKSGKTLELYSQTQMLYNEVVGCVFSFRDITERKKLDEQLTFQATHDILTGLPNRGLLRDRMQQAISHAKRYEFEVGIMLLDLDGFKQINDSLGHAAGDSLLQVVSNKLKANLRGEDTISRLGGDEFVIVISAVTSQEHLIEKGNEILSILSEPMIINDNTVRVTASIGVSIFPKDGDNVDTLLKYADAALYFAKEKGKNNIQFFSIEFSQYILTRADLISDLYHALKNNELTLKYQPVITLASRKVAGIEALLRWQHPSLGEILPDIFVPLAEAAGLMVNIGAWVLRTACLQVKAWQQNIHPELKVSVNISMKQFRDPGFVELLRKILAETKLEPRFLELEVTEIITSKLPTQTLEKMNELKALGVRLAIDNFGTGYVSLSYLRHFPFDKIKIDKRFIEDATENQEDAFIIDAIIAMSKTIGLDVVAEGVESKEQLNFLVEHCSQDAQGFYFSMPLGIDEFERVLREKFNEKFE